MLESGKIQRSRPVTSKKIPMVMYATKELKKPDISFFKMASTIVVYEGAKLSI